MKNSHKGSVKSRSNQLLCDCWFYGILPSKPRPCRLGASTPLSSGQTEVPYTEHSKHLSQAKSFIASTMALG